MNKLLALSMLLSCTAIATAQVDSPLDVSRIAKEVEQQIKACPRREVVAEFKRGLHKTVWQKQAWGPPSDVIADVKSNDSILYPYVLTVEFSLSFSHGPEHKNKTEAETETELSPSSVLIQLGADTSRNRNIYLVNKDGIRLKTREILKRKLLDDTPAQWGERSAWANACWDRIGAQ
jgi:hypothetical protein